MTEFTPARRVSALAPNYFRAMDRAVAAAAAEPGERVINASKGNPDLPTPSHIVAAMQDAVADPRNHGYPGGLARASVREAIAERYRADHGVDLDPLTQVAIFHGSHEAFMAAVLALTDPGDTVVLPDPGFPIYSSAVQLAGGRSATLPLTAPGDQPDLRALDKLDHARALLLNYPNNPTGTLASVTTFEDTLATTTRLGAAFIHDFAYAGLGFDGRRPLSALAVDRSFDRTVEVGTVSKTYSMAGWRFGYAVGNTSVIDAMRRYQSHAYSSMFGATQEAAAIAIGGDQRDAARVTATYQARRDRLVAGLRALGWNLTAPAGSFFVWARIPGDDDDDVAWTARLLDETRVAVAPGSGFGSRGRGFVRFSLVVDDDTIDELLARFARSPLTAPARFTDVTLAQQSAAVPTLVV